MKLNDFFDKVFCINLERRTDRRMESDMEFAKHHVDVEYIKGIDAKYMSVPIKMSEDGTVIAPGYYGCLLSHLRVLKIAKERGYKNYCIFEDDCEFSDLFRDRFHYYIENVPDNWDCIMFGGNHQEKPKMVADNVAKISKTYTTHAFGVKETMYDALIEAWDKIEKLDISLSKLQKRFNFYVFQPHLVMQRASHSDILERHNGDWTLEKRPT